MTNSRPPARASSCARWPRGPGGRELGTPMPTGQLQWIGEPFRTGSPTRPCTPSRSAAPSPRRRAGSTCSAPEAPAPSPSPSRAGSSKRARRSWASTPTPSRRSSAPDGACAHPPDRGRAGAGHPAQHPGQEGGAAHPGVVCTLLHGNRAGRGGADRRGRRRSAGRGRRAGRRPRQPSASSRRASTGRTCPSPADRTSSSAGRGGQPPYRRGGQFRCAGGDAVAGRGGSGAAELVPRSGRAAPPSPTPCSARPSRAAGCPPRGRRGLRTRPVTQVTPAGRRAVLPRGRLRRLPRLAGGPGAGPRRIPSATASATRTGRTRS